MTQVVIGDILPYTQAIATASQTVFGTNWTANYASDVVVYQTPSGEDADDDTQILAYPADYSVDFIGALLQVQVTLVTGAAAGDRITVTRQTPADRLNLYTNTNFTPTMLNNDFGILTLVDQQAQVVDQKIGPRYNYSAIIVDLIDTILPILPANCGWVKNPADTAIIPYEFPESGIAPAGASYVTTTDETSDLPNSFALSGIAQGVMINLPGTNAIIARSMTATANQLGVTNPTGFAGDINYYIADNPIIPGTAGMGIPSGTTAQRVTPLSNIGLRYNSTISAVEYWNGSAWVQLVNDTFTDATFILQVPDASLPNAQALSALASGLVSVTTTTGVLASRILTGTANQIDIANGDCSNTPTFSLSATMDLPGTFTIQGSTVIDEIIDDDSMATASDSNVPTAESVVAYIGSELGAYLPLAGGTMLGSIVMGDNTGILSTQVATDQFVISGYDTGLLSAVALATITVGNPVVMALTPTTLNIDGSTTVDEIIDDDTMATATDSNLATAESIVAYVSATVGGYLPLAGGAMAGNIDMVGNDVENIGVASFKNGAFAQSFTSGTLAGNLDYVLPTGYPSVTGYILSSTDAGVMSWIANTAGSMVSVVGTANEIDVDDTDPQNPILSLSATLDLPGTFTIQNTVDVDEILDEDNMASDSPTGLATQQSIKAYVDNAISGAGSNTLTALNVLLMGG